MELFASKIKPLQKKQRSYTRLIGADTQGIEVPIQTMNLLTDVSKAEISQIILNYTSQTRRQKNCMIIRQYLEILPSTPSYYSSFWNWSWNPFASKDPHKEMKSYRTMAYRILSRVEHKDPGLAEMIEEKIDELQAMKMIYFEQFYEHNPNEQKEKKKKHKDSLQEIAQLKKQIYDLKVEMIYVESQIEGGYSALGKYAKNDLTNEESLHKKMEEIDWLTNKKNQIELASTDEEIERVIKSVKENKFLVALREELRILTDYRQMIESVEFLISRAPSEQSKLDLLTQSLEALQKQKKTLESQVTSSKKTLISPIEKRIKKLENVIYYDKNYNQYKKTIQSVISMKKKLNGQKTKMNDLQMQIEKKRLEVDTFNPSDFSDFVLPSSVLFNLKARFEELQKLETFTGMRLPRSDGKDIPQQKMQDLDGKYNDYLDRLDNVQYVLRMGIQDHVQETKKSLVGQMYLVGKIEDFEKELDEILGEVFGEIFEIEGDKRCFSVPQISYLFFNMFKTNIVSNQHRFLIIFLNHIRFNQAKEFTLYNYSLFTNKEFILNFESKYDSSHAEPGRVFQLREEYISQFSVNYLSVIDIYKDLTEFRDPTQALDKGEVFMKVWRSIGINLGQMLMSDLTEYGLETFIKSLLKHIIGLIPFVSAIPFLDTVASFIIWKITSFVTKKLMQLFGKYASVIYSSMSKFLSAQSSQDFGFDFEKIIDDAFKPEPISTKINFSFEDLDKIYYEAYTVEHALYDSSIENARFYKPKPGLTNSESVTYDVNQFNQIVLGELILKRLFKSGVSAHILDDQTDYDLSEVKDLELKAHLFDSVYNAICYNSKWRFYFFKKYQQDIPERHGVTREGEKYIDII